MSKALYTNNAASITAANILAADSTLTLATGDGALFPAPAVDQHAIVTLTDGTAFEIIRVTANVADVLTFTRAQEGTTAVDWAAGTTVSQRLTAGAFQALLDMEGIGVGNQRSVQSGIGSTATGSSSIAVGKNCFATASSAAAMGYGGSCGGRNATAMGTNTTANGDYDAAVGSDCQVGVSTYTYYSVAVGTQCTASSSYAVALGSQCRATADSSLAVGYAVRATGQGSTAVGHSARSTGQNSSSFGSFARASGVDSLAIGTRAQSPQSSSLAVGARQVANAVNSIAVGTTPATNSLPDSTMIQGALAVRASFASASPHRDFAAAEVVLMTEAIPMTVAGSKVITLPVGSVFVPTSVGVLVTSQTGIITTQPTVLASISTDNITFTPLTTAALMTALSAPRKFQDLAIGIQTSAGLYLKGEVTIAGVATLLYNARFYFKGIVVQE